ncbi:MAG: hypothetical protein ABW221_24275 [Vicinamibacteria bacterium]
MTDPLEPAGVPAAPADAKVAPPKAITIRYLGFKDVDGRRQYALQAQRGAETSQYTVSIELAAFSKKQALLQDGPDICYQKLRELSVVELHPSGEVEVTEAELAAYRETHSRAPRRTFSSPAPEAPARVAEEQAEIR